MRFSLLTIIFAMFIIISASFMRQVFDFIIKTAGKERLEFMILALFCAAGLMILFYLIKRGISLLKVTAIVVIFILGSIFAWQLELIAERVHVLEYGLLGWLSIRDINKFKRGLLHALFLSLIFVLAISFADETFQKILPFRVGELRDVLFNCLAGTWGIILFLSKNMSIKERG